jgi:hypothetical protein
VNRRRAQQDEAADCVDSLNSLAGARSSSASRSFDYASVLPIQRSVLDRVAKHAFVAPPSGEKFSPEAALRALLRADSQYSGSANGLTPFVVGAVSLPVDQVTAAPIEKLLEGQALREVRECHTRMLLSPEELEGELEQGLAGLYHDPVLERSECKYLDFVCELFKSGIVNFNPWVKVEVGVFFVLKKNRKLRLILDARRSNQHFRRPPSRNNCSAGSFSNLRVPAGETL